MSRPAILWVSIGVLRGDDDWARRGSPALAWTGERLFVYGGNPVPSESESALTVEPLNDAALIDPANGDVDQLPDPPFDRPLRLTRPRSPSTTRWWSSARSAGRPTTTTGPATPVRTGVRSTR